MLEYPVGTNKTEAIDPKLARYITKGKIPSELLLQCGRLFLLLLAIAFLAAAISIVMAVVILLLSLFYGSDPVAVAMHVLLAAAAWVALGFLRYWCNSVFMVIEKRLHYFHREIQSGKVVRLLTDRVIVEGLTRSKKRAKGFRRISFDEWMAGRAGEGKYVVGNYVDLRDDQPDQSS